MLANFYLFQDTRVSSYNPHERWVVLISFRTLYSLSKYYYCLCSRLYEDLGGDPNLARLTCPLTDEALHLVALGIRGGGVRRLLQVKAFSGQL
jgi:hypothetical protein